MCLRRGRSGWLAVLASRKLCAGARRGLPKKGEPALLERGDPSERPGPAAITRCAGKLAFLGPAAPAAVRRTAPWPLAARPLPRPSSLERGARRSPNRGNGGLTELVAKADTGRGTARDE